MSASSWLCTANTGKNSPAPVAASAFATPAPVAAPTISVYISTHAALILEMDQREMTVLSTAKAAVSDSTSALALVCGLAQMIRVIHSSETRPSTPFELCALSHFAWRASYCFFNLAWRCRHAFAVTAYERSLRRRGGLSSTATASSNDCKASVINGYRALQPWVALFALASKARTISRKRPRRGVAPTTGMP